MTDVVLLAAARQDIEQITDHYLAEAGIDVTTGFLRAYDRAARQLAEFPESGSLRFAFGQKFQGLRAWPMRGYPYLLFYLYQKNQVLILRVLHAAREVPPGLRE